MKILITSDWYYPVVNGVVRSVLNLKEYLENRGHEVKVLTLSNTMKSYKAGNIYYVGSLSARKIYPEARVTNLLSKTHIKELEGWGPDIIHSQCEFSTFIMAKTIAHDLKIPIIHTYHTIYEDYTHYFIGNKTMGKKAVALASKKFSDLCNGLIAPSEKTAKLLREYGVDEGKISVIATGIRIPDLLTENPRKDLGIDEKEKVLLYLGRIGEEKNIEELVDFYQKIDDPDVKLYIVGGGPHLDDLMDFARSFPKKVNFLGMVNPEDVNKYYQMADVFVSGSTSETQGLTYYEALSNGTVAVCRKDAALCGVIVNGYNGYVYENFEEFEKIINKVLNKEFKTYLSKNARSYAIEKFSIEAFGEKCERLYQKAIEEYEYESFNIFKRL
ncbi:GDP-mannose-dependent alpha-mannosyltransferase [Anaerococcus prevotii]|uniref:Glycosyl transferase group 1 n=1 Tax=Anaerococcus prevotii (strain ATCC 9321 / DSM 20548 / JCM 6508 / NCTC 11806 / PC1) TaxID=525919 RepID=C7RFF0_ANAPD|nr:glycosyltransferase [Anaerococcus prevotii]ACV28211.1 glycosyl transferase group 1 [Anaerococcus prevotii DSM 20548]SUU93765.1 GDP-mannose-dependent alpha-mannosyltransferase [Anaerococcus prevotii]